MLINQVLMVMVLTLPVVGYAQNCYPENIPANTPTSQFTDNRNGTVLDNKTGLMWKKCSEGQLWDNNTNSCNGAATPYVWKSALQQAQFLNTNGGFASYTDWRVPNINELESIVEKQCDQPAINLSIFSNVSPISFNESQFWSSSPAPTSGYGSHGAWLVNFVSGSDETFNKADYSFAVRLVRSGQ